MSKLLGKTKGSILVVLLSSQLLVAQKKHPFIHFLVTPDTTVSEGISLYGSFESRNLFSIREPVTNLGLNAGVAIGPKRHLLLVGYQWYSMTDNALVDFRKPVRQWINRAYYTAIDVAFYTVSFRPQLIRQKRWRLSTFSDIGYGVGIKENPEFKDRFLWKNASHFLPVQAGIRGDFVASRYIGIKLIAGYRASLNKSDIPYRLSGIFYDVSTSVYLTPIFHDFKKIIRHEKLY